MISSLVQAAADQCAVVDIFNGFFNMVQVVLLAWLANRAVHKDRHQAAIDHDALEKIRKP